MDTVGRGSPGPATPNCHPIMNDFAPRYRYALSANGETIDVTTLALERRETLKPFRCLACDGDMVARLPRDRKKHFSHRAIASCSAETYLHRLAKRCFVATYQRCVAEGRPFALRYTVTDTCSHYAQTLGLNCERERVVELDLTKFFSVADEEREVGGFRADVLLSSPARSEVMLVELSVSHRCTEDKRASGLRILEIAIGSEDDVAAIGRARIDATAGRAECINFLSRTRPSSSCGGGCETPVWYFVVYPSQKSVLASRPATEVAEDIMRRRVPHREILGPDVEDVVAEYRDRVRRAHFAGVRVRNCFICTYHGGEGVENAVFCKARRESVGSNEAVTCSTYRPLATLEACAEVDRRNEEYLSKSAVTRIVRHVMGSPFGVE